MKIAKHSVRHEINFRTYMYKHNAYSGHQISCSITQHHLIYLLSAIAMPSSTKLALFHLFIILGNWVSAFSHFQNDNQFQSVLNYRTGFLPASSNWKKNYKYHDHYTCPVIREPCTMSRIWESFNQSINHHQNNYNCYENTIMIAL